MLENELGLILFEQSPMRLAILSVPDYCYEMANGVESRFCESMGITGFIGRKWTDVWKTAPPDKFFAALENVRKSRKPYSVIDEPAELIVDGKTRRICSSYYYFPIYGPDDSVQHILWACKDTTYRVASRKAEEEARLLAQRSRDEMAKQLRAVSLLHDISTKVMTNTNWEDVLSTILDAAIEIGGGQLGCIQLVDTAADTLHLVLGRGFVPQFLESFDKVYRHSHTSCAKAWAQGERVVLEDTETSEFMAGTRELDIYRQAGIRAVQSTPVISRSGLVVGMLSTHYQVPTGFSKSNLELMDLLARHLANILDSYKLERAEREARQEAEQRAAEWEALIQASPDAIYVTDEEGALLEANPAWYAYTGVEHATAIAVPSGFPELYMTTPDGRPIARQDEPTARVCRGEKVANLLYRIVNKKGQEFEFLYNATAIDTPRGKRTLSIATDITELKRLERLKDEFMLVVSHELRNPLQIILGQLQLMDIKLGDESRRQVGTNVDSLLNQTRLLMSLVEDLLSAYRVGTGKLSVTMTKIDFRNVVTQALATYLGDVDHNWSFFLPKRAVRVMADTQRLEQIVLNLLSNAKKYTPPGKCIWVNLTTGEGQAILRVEDEGPGIPPTDLEKVFDGFYRAAEVSKWKSGSVGLGLYISRGLARRMGGDLWAENRPDGGTVMCLKMPLMKQCSCRCSDSR